MRVRRSILLTTAAVAALVVGPNPSASAAAACGLDPSFGTNGILTAPDYTVDYGHAVGVDAQGRYLVAGEGGRALAVMRLLPSGELDTSFGGRGVVYVSHDPIYTSTAWGMVQLADGRIAVAGTANWAVSPTSWGDIAVAVLNPDGSPDTGFGGGDGVTYLDLGERNDFARSIDVDVQGRLVVAGASDDFSAAPNVVLARLLPDGSLDSTFGTDGFALHSLGSYGTAYGVDVLADGQILAVGSRQVDYIQPWLGRFLADGTPDASFGRAGFVLPTDPGALYDVTVGPRGTVLVGGSEGLDLLVGRYTSSGRVDRAYGGGDGKALVSAPNEWAANPFAKGLAVLADGSVLATGAAVRTQYSEGVIARVDPRGQLDRGFGTGGVIYHSEDPQYSSAEFAAAAPLPGGGAIVAGTGYAGAILARTC